MFVGGLAGMGSLPAAGPSVAGLAAAGSAATGLTAAEDERAFLFEGITVTDNRERKRVDEVGYRRRRFVVDATRFGLVVARVGP
jgi:hypothetical protein